MSNTINIKELQKSRNRDRKGAGANDNGNDKGSSWDFLQKDIKLFGSRLPDKVKESFYLELSTLLAAGIDIRTALELAAQEQTKKKYKKIFGDVLQQVLTGATLSVALHKNKEFTAYEYYSIRIGEETGKLNHILHELSVFFKKKIKQRQQMIGALTYPVLVTVVAISAVSFMVMYVVPMFADVFKRFGGELPFITRMVLSAAGFAKRFAGLFALLVLAIGLFVVLSRRKPWFRSISSKMLLRIPLMGAIIKKIHLARFADTMALLTASRIPIIQGIGLVRQMIGFYPIEASLTQVEEGVMSGMPLHKSLSQHSVYPRKMISLLKAGEEVNQLALFFSKIAEQYATEVEYQTSLLSKFIEPFIIILLGLIVGVILIAMYLPLFKLGQSF